MCGYSGVIFNSTSIFSSNAEFKAKFFVNASNVKHRGNEPMRKVEFDNLLLAHFRLAFVDLASNFQPMLSKNKKWVIVFNGEIYNHNILRKKITAEQGYKFETKSDTETILEGFLNYGLEIEKYIDGEYSFVICNTDGSEMIAMRDPFGVKPLFLALEDVQTNIFSTAKDSYLFKTPSIQFSSEIKGLSIPKRWNKEGFLRQFVGLYEPIRTPYQNIIQVPANSFLYAKKQGDMFICKLQMKKVPVRPPLNDNDSNQEELYSEFAKSLQKSVAHRMLSEVELGVYLSGGIDSKAVTYEAVQYYLKNKIKNPLKTFTISFEAEEYSESTEALSFAQKMGVTPNILKVSNDNLIYSYKHAVYHSENIQPYTNGSAKWWLSRFTGKYVKGVLTGDGADELFCGYPSFHYASWWKFALNIQAGENILDRINKLPTGNSLKDSGVFAKKASSNEKDPWLAGSSSEGSGEDFIESLKIWGIPHPLFGQIKTIATSILGNEEALKWLADQKESVASWFSFGLSSEESFLTDPKNALLLWQNYFTKTHLPVQVLNWVGDRMEMANTVEGRTPFLSKEMSHIAAKLKDSMLIRGTEDKSILRRSYQKRLGQAALTPKKQFGAPFLFNEVTLKTHFDQIIVKAKETGLIDVKYVTSLYDFMKNDFLKKKASPHVLAHLNSAFQTLICFSYLDDFLIKGNAPSRNMDYEEKVITNQKII
ncbi:asparagine synthase (glutamine-hydrolyzing) [Silvanigrella sp.]|jgi:asparagine synthase (glutamine-hydrolysing)|uniref:asparagine synthase (glutamine-hydrolyzing) n=1 Tax=Silvanigrella sp. TaxID=2024976 RepID=UPI0037C88E9D